jgi:hypothetical protein
MGSGLVFTVVIVAEGGRWLISPESVLAMIGAIAPGPTVCANASFACAGAGAGALARGALVDAAGDGALARGIPAGGVAMCGPSDIMVAATARLSVFGPIGDAAGTAVPDTAAAASRWPQCWQKANPVGVCLPQELQTIFPCASAAATGAGAGAAKELPHILQKFIPGAFCVPHAPHTTPAAAVAGLGFASSTIRCPQL